MRAGPLAPVQAATAVEHAIDGDFDACQALVKQAFDDEELKVALGLNSANSINIICLRGSEPNGLPIRIQYPLLSMVTEAAAFKLL